MCCTEDVLVATAIRDERGRRPKLNETILLERGPDSICDRNTERNWSSLLIELRASALRGGGDSRAPQRQY